MKVKPADLTTIRLMAATVYASLDDWDHDEERVQFAVQQAVDIFDQAREYIADN